MASKTTMIDVEMHVAVDGDGQWVAVREDEDASEKHCEEYGECGYLRCFVVKVRVPFCVPVLCGAVPADGEATLTVS